MSNMAENAGFIVIVFYGFMLLLFVVPFLIGLGFALWFHSFIPLLIGLGIGLALDLALLIYSRFA